MGRSLMRSILSIFLFAGIFNCDKLIIQSSWAIKPVVVDGAALEWESSLTNFDESGIVIGVKNDTNWLYLCLLSGNENFNRQAARQGFTLYFKHHSLKSGKLGARFIPASHHLGIPPQRHMTSQDNEEYTRPPLQQFKPQLQAIELTGPGNDSTTIAATVAVRYGIEASFGVADGKTLCEIKLPLYDRDSTIFSLQMSADTLLSLAVETTPMKMPDGDRPPMQSGMPPSGNGNGGNRDRGMGPPPGGMMSGPGGDGPQGGNPLGKGGMMQMPSQISFACQILIAKEKSSVD